MSINEESSVDLFEDVKADKIREEAVSYNTAKFDEFLSDNKSDLEHEFCVENLDDFNEFCLEEFNKVEELL